MESQLSTSVHALAVTSAPASLMLRRYSEAGVQWVANTPLALTFAAGGVAGTVSRTLTAPMDRIKVLSQEGRAKEWFMPHPTVNGCASTDNELKSMVKMARYIAATGGVKSFWRGNGVNCLKAGPECAIALATRQMLVNRFVSSPSGPSPLEQVAVGAGAGLIAQVFLYPMEVVKTRIAVSQKNEYRGVADCIILTVKRRGVRDLYRGMCANAAGIVPHRGIEMGIFFSLEQVLLQRQAGRTQQQQHAPPRSLPLYQTLGVGLIASVVAQVCTYPLNLARTRLQTQGVNGRPVKYSGLLSCLTSVVKESGARGLFAGIVPNMLKAVPSSCVMFVTFRKAQDAIKAFGGDGATTI